MNRSSQYADTAMRTEAVRTPTAKDAKLCEAIDGHLPIQS